jgi:hypothetical protein
MTISLRRGLSPRLNRKWWLPILIFTVEEFE